MGYVADFVTGRSIAEKEPAVGVVIIPQTGGWPDPVKAAAIDPTHAHDKFSPLSLPLAGFINDQGYFEPKPNQLALTLLLDTTGFKTWKAFFEKSYVTGGEGREGIELGRDKKKVIAGIAAMRPETYKTLITQGKRYSPGPDRAVDAARIQMDAQRRWNEDKENKVFFVGIMSNPPRGDNDVWTTKEGDKIRIPDCSLGLADGYSWDLNGVAKDHIRKAYENAYLGNAEDFAPLFELFGQFQSLCRGLQDVGKYFMPGGFMRHDNIAEITTLQFDALEGAIKNAAKRDYTGVEYRDEEFLVDMAALQKRIDSLQSLLTKEIAKAHRILGTYEAEEAAEERASKTPGM